MYFAMKDTNERTIMCKPINKYQHIEDDVLAFARATLLVTIIAWQLCVHFICDYQDERERDIERERDQ
jgi:hypothetical protein